MIIAPLRVDLSGGWPDSDPYRKDFGGAVLNCAINRYAEGLEYNGFHLNLPKSNGLGSSGAIRAIYLVMSNPELLKDKDSLIRRVHILENQAIGQRAGFQDQAASIYGGINYWEFSRDGQIGREKIDMDLKDRLSLVHFGSHSSNDMHSQVFSRYEQIKDYLHQMKNIADKMTDKRENLGSLMNWTLDLQRNIRTVTPEMDKFLKKHKNHFDGAKVCGAGGGGYMVFLDADFGERVQVENLGLRILEEQ